MNDSSDLKVSGCVEELMSEDSLRGLNEAEGVLLIGDGCPVWLQHILSALAGTKEPLDKAFLAILYILMYESGYYFLGGPHNDSITYDIRLMRLLSNPDITLKNMKKEDSQYVTTLSHNLLYPKYITVVSYSTYDAFNEPIMVVNFVQRESMIISTKLYHMKPCFNKSVPNKFQLVNAGCKDVSVKFKNFLYSYKSLMSGEYYHPHHILSLPQHILQLLCKYLDVLSFCRFTQTCRYMNETFSMDETLWKYHSLKDFRGLNKLNHETWKDHYKYETKPKMIYSNLPPMHLSPSILFDL